MIEEMRSFFTVTILNMLGIISGKCQTESKAQKLRNCRREKQQMEKYQEMEKKDFPALSPLLVLIRCDHLQGTCNLSGSQWEDSR